LGSLASALAADVDAIDALRGTDVVRMALDQVGSEPTIDGLASDLEDSLAPPGDRAMRRLVIRLAEAGRGAPAVLVALQAWNTDVSAEAAGPVNAELGAARLAVDDARRAIMGALLDADPDVRSTAAAGVLLLRFRNGSDREEEQDRLRSELTDGAVRLDAALRAMALKRRWMHRDAVAAAAAKDVADAPALLDLLEQALSETEEGSPVQEAVYAIIAKLAAQSPAVLNAAGRWLSSGLVAGCLSDNHWLRRDAITALGHLRRLGPECGRALQHLCRDIDEVRDAAIETAGRFQRFDAAVLDELLPVLTAPSITAAYAVALLLGELGTGRQAVEQPAVRRRIADALAAACADSGASRSGGPGQRPLSETYYESLLKVAG
jgi:hypothetical protein